MKLLCGHTRWYTEEYYKMYINLLATNDYLYESFLSSISLPNFSLFNVCRIVFPFLAYFRRRSTHSLINAIANGLSVEIKARARPYADLILLIISIRKLSSMLPLANVIAAYITEDKIKGVSCDQTRSLYCRKL